MKIAAAIVSCIIAANSRIDALANSHNLKHRLARLQRSGNGEIIALGGWRRYVRTTVKGVFLQQQIEYRLEAAGEGFHQGDELPCILSLKNHGAAAQPLAELRLELALGDIKKIKQKAEGSFEILSSAELAPPAEIASRQTLSFDWRFRIDDNAPLSDKSQSLYLLFGAGENDHTLGQLPLVVQAHSYIQVILRILETTFSFVLKGQRSSKGWVTAKLKPPAARRFTTVDDLALSFRLEGGILVLRYLFHIKKFEATAASIGVKKAKSELEQRLEPGKYLFPGGIVDHAPLEKAIEEALAEVASTL